MKNITTAKKYIDLTNLWENTDKNIVIENIERVFGDSKTLKINQDGTRVNTLSILTNTDKNTVRAWMNQSRTKVKIPLLKLCMIAEGLNIDVELLLTDRGDWRNSDDIPGYLKSVFEKIRMNQYYREGKWDIDSFVNDVHKEELYNNSSIKSKVDKLADDCMKYFKIIVGINDSEIYNRIITVAKSIHSEQGEY